MYIKKLNILFATILLIVLVTSCTPEKISIQTITVFNEDIPVSFDVGSKGVNIEHINLNELKNKPNKSLWATYDFAEGNKDKIKSFIDDGPKVFIYGLGLNSQIVYNLFRIEQGKQLTTSGAKDNLTSYGCMIYKKSDKYWVNAYLSYQNKIDNYVMFDIDYDR
ncbi:MAG TPA: hypothetical protein VIO64_09940 [Pseudobacteroides sp.]|uniref:hypothetical protein n=1 Tax=Pseudobacteroides sp. TaxID=1968840 RepID=UPI002F91DD3D